MVGPYAVGEGNSEYARWECSHCGHTCEKFLFEMEAAVSKPHRRAWWMDDKRWEEMVTVVRPGQKQHNPEIYALRTDEDEVNE